MTQPNEARLFDLLSDQATVGLAPENEQELNQLLAACPDIDPDSMAITAAAADLAMEFEMHELPASLRQKIEMDAAAHLTASGPQSVPTKSVAPTVGGEVVEMTATVQRLQTLNTLGWIAAAACLVLAFLAWNREAEIPVKPLEEAKPSPVDMRADLIKNSGDYTQWEWNVLDDPTATDGVTGDVVWSESRQQGFMRIKGLQPNVDGSFVYQLWVFDKSRNAEHPVDGGVFNISESGEIVVPIDAKLPVRELDFFAVTVEPPGGVVVSSRERIVLTAAPPKA